MAHRLRTVDCVDDTRQADFSWADYLEFSELSDAVEALF
jgi:hypothetical protein